MILKSPKFALIVLVSLFIGCKPKPSQVIDGYIAGYNQQPVLLYFADSVYINKPYGKPFAKTFTNDSGKFSFSFQHVNKNLFHLFAQDNKLLVETPFFLFPNDTTGIETSIFNTTRPDFYGANKAINSHLHYQRRSLSDAFRYNRVNVLPINKFEAFIDSIQSGLTLKIDSIATTKERHREICEILYADMLLFLAAKRYEYLQNHINETTGERKYLLPSNEFYWFSEDLTEKYSTYWFLPSFSMAIDAIIEDEFQKHLANSNEPEQVIKKTFETKLQIAQANFTGISFDVALARLSQRYPEFLVNQNFFQQLKIADSLMANIPKNYALSQYYWENSNKISKLKPGYPAPNFTLSNVENIDISINDSKGKVILLSFWGTWCPPCLKSIPKYIEIQEHFTNRDVKFIFVALESRADDVENWRNFVAGKGYLAEQLLKGRPFSGIHLVAQGQFRNPEIQPYVVTYAPTYVLIDKKGRIVLPRTNLDDSLIKKIEKLLEE